MSPPQTNTLEPPKPNAAQREDPDAPPKDVATSQPATAPNNAHATVSLGRHLFVNLVHRFPWFWIRFANFESAALRDRLERVRIERPIFICGLARSGSTILLELIASHPAVTTHKYRDFPPVFTPYWWNQSLSDTPNRHDAPEERAHGDGLMVTPDSPEAMEEPLWMAFFKNLHAPSQSHVLTPDHRNPRFDAFYLDHIRKLLLVRGGRRYASKGNYNVARIEYLLDLFPDARFVIPIRDPLTHVGSLMKQHRLFCEIQDADPRARPYLKYVGHFEFGRDRHPINFANNDDTQRVQDLWDRGEAARAWARSWRQVYQHVADLLQRNAKLRDAALVVRYEDLCRQPSDTTGQICHHCRLDMTDEVRSVSDNIHFPTYYKLELTEAQRQAIAEETRQTAEHFGYQPN